LIAIGNNKHKFDKLSEKGLDKINSLGRGLHLPHSGRLPSTLHLWDITNNFRHKELTNTLHILELPNWLHADEGVITSTIVHTVDDFIALVDYCQSVSIDKLKEVPIIDEIIEEIKKVSYSSILNNVDSDEYVYNINELASPKGKNYADFRSRINKFNRLYPEHQLVYSDKKPDKNTYKKIKALYEIWHDFDTDSAKDSSNEDLALQKYIESKENYLNRAENYYLYYKNKLVAYAMVEIIDNTYAVGHFLKVNLNLTGSSEYFIHKICKSLKNAGVEHLNAQEDMGVIGLRDYKQRLRPTKMIRTYDISLG